VQRRLSRFRRNGRTWDRTRERSQVSTTSARREARSGSPGDLTLAPRLAA
jgi:hypothetical protein